MTLTLRYMRIPDIPPVIVIDHLSFDPAWSSKSYAFEVSESNYSHMVVLEQTRAPNHDEHEERSGGFWNRLRGTRSGREKHGETESEIVGYGGLWNIADEAHISTIATHPTHRGKGWGEVLVAGMIGKAIRVNAAYLVLEVRVSNLVAQRLYAKYGFTIEGIKPQYYSNNREDAYDMRLPLRDNPEYIEPFFARYADLLKRQHVIDTYVDGAPARRG